MGELNRDSIDKQLSKYCLDCDYMCNGVCAYGYRIKDKVKSQGEPPKAASESTALHNANREGSEGRLKVDPVQNRYEAMRWQY